MEEINQLKREGLSILAISNLTGYNRKTIRKYLLELTAKPEYPLRAKAAGKLEPFKAYLSERLQAGVWNARVLLRELRSRNYTGGYIALRSAVHPQRGTSRRSDRAECRCWGRRRFRAGNRAIRAAENCRRQREGSFCNPADTAAPRQTKFAGSA